ncbi:MAG TPA: amino acid ABC transporter permease [Clostridiaceae bacterium]|jgi:polar amino acid transport system permease protein|nr:amino acid ABC transporter permease [Clostridiaceae bacterium]
MDNLRSTITQLLSGMTFTLMIFILTLLFSLPLGLLVAKGRMSRNRLLSGATRFYISVMRGTPLMLQLLIVYFGPWYLFKIPLRNLSIGQLDYRFVATIIGFSVNYAAYFAEIFRGGIQSMPQGQYEAAQLLGFSKSQTFFRIIMPQVIKRVLPSVTNEVITLVKDTSLAQVLAVSEMFIAAKSLASTQVSVIPFIVAGVFYYLMNGVIEIGMNSLERKLNYYS